MILSYFSLSLVIHNVWPQRMSFKSFLVLFMMTLLAGIPVTIFSCVPYGLFGFLVAICIFGLIINRDTAPQNICMGMIGCILAVIMSSLLKNILSVIIPSDLSDNPYFSLGIELIHILLLYIVTLLLGRLIKKLLLSGKGSLRFQQTWYLIDAVLLLLITIYLFDDFLPGQNGSVGKMIYNNVLHILGYLLVVLLLVLAVRRFYFEKVQAEAKQKAIEDLQGYTNNLETMYNSLRSFKHDYINILLSISGYIENGDMEELKKFFDDKILPTKNLIDQGDYKLNQLSNIGVLEIKSLLSAKMIYAHESGIDVTIDIPDRIEHFAMDIIDLARILGIFLDNAIEAAFEAEQPKIGLNIIQNNTGVAIIISNRFQDNGLVLHKLKQKGFSTKSGHQGIGLSNAQKIINSYDNVLFETTIQGDTFVQHMELAVRKE